MRNKIKVALLLLMFGAPLMSHSQTLRYQYDETGNRTNRMNVLMLTKNNGRQYEDYSLSKDVLMRGDASRGTVEIEILKFDNSDECECSVFDYSGQQVFSTKPLSNITSLDLSHCPSGVYILQVSLNGKKSVWKIVKQ